MTRVNGPHFIFGHDANVILVLVLAALECSAECALAENIDPDNDHSRWAWSENVGWINAEPGGEGGAGVHVSDFNLVGWMWGENVGWLSLSCSNTGSCEMVDYGVRNDGQGGLSGYAWSKNVGWVDFGPPSAGVAISPSTGEFGGLAWGENIGWIAFASGTEKYKLRTSWRCDPAPESPEGAPRLIVERSGTTLHLAWYDSPAGTTGFDVIQGGLDALRSSDGDFTSATGLCVRNNTSANSLQLPAAGEGTGTWFLVRALNCGGAGTYDDLYSSQVGSRDDEVSAAASACP